MSRLKGNHDKLGKTGGDFNQRPSDEGPILVEVEGLQDLYIYVGFIKNTPKDNESKLTERSY